MLEPQHRTELPPLNLLIPQKHLLRLEELCVSLYHLRQVTLPAFIRRQVFRNYSRGDLQLCSCVRMPSCAYIRGSCVLSRKHLICVFKYEGTVGGQVVCEVVPIKPHHWLFQTSRTLRPWLSSAWKASRQSYIHTSRGVSPPQAQYRCAWVSRSRFL